MKRKVLYDPKCFELAELFLSDYRSEIEEIDKGRVEELAEEIQQTIEDFISDIEQRNASLKQAAL